MVVCFCPLSTILVFWEAWRMHLHYQWITGIKWKLLEIKVPKTILKTPKAMEQIFAAAHAPYTYGIRFYNKYLKGQEEYWMAFELIGPRRRDTFLSPRTRRNFAI